MLRLITSLELLSNHKSFIISLDNAREKLWLLLHLKDLSIEQYKLFYQVNNGIRQRPNTVHPVRQMKKKFDDTPQLIHYLNQKSYDILKLEITFSNGWVFREASNHYFTFYTNSVLERDKLIKKLMQVAGYEKVSLDNLKPNITYLINPIDHFVDLELGENADEFWSKERRAIWVKKCSQDFNFSKIDKLENTKK